MTKNPLPKSVSIIGAGAAGLFAARRLKQIGVQDITLFEKEDQIGGKCSTYSDPINPKIIAERGAVVVAPNYGEVIQALKEYGIRTERTISAEGVGVEIMAHMSKLDRFEKIKFICQMGNEFRKFCQFVKIYRSACEHLQPIPAELEFPFAILAKNHGMENISLFLKPFVTGFGYGDLNDCPAYSVLEYMGYLTIPYLIAQHYGFESCELRSIAGGFQGLMKKIGNHFNTHTSASIHDVHRDASGVGIKFIDRHGKHQFHHSDVLVLAISPIHWKNIFAKNEITTVEEECVKLLSHYSYPIVICRLKGCPPNYFYRPEFLNRERFGRIALVSTLDKRENPSDGRLCSAYINTLPINSAGSNEHSFLSQQNVLEDLHSLPHVTDAEIVEYKVWDDYFTSLPWQVRLDLEKHQMAPNTKTIYAGCYTLGCFEDVACVANRIIKVINNCFN